MALSNQQIERYARQIILPGVGGQGQERLLASRVFIAGSAKDFESGLAYLVAAGVGSIRFAFTDAFFDWDRLLRDLEALNSDSRVEQCEFDCRVNPDGFNLLLLVLNNLNRQEIRAWYRNFRLYRFPTIAMRIEDPAEITVVNATPPCLECADDDLFGPRNRKARYADVAVMMATTEALKLLLGLETRTAVKMLLPNLTAEVKPLKPRRDCALCSG